MTRDALLRMLATAVTAGLITEADAVLLRERFDAGTLSQADLPAEPERGITRTQVAAAAFLLAAVLGRGLRARRTESEQLLSSFASSIAASTSSPINGWQLVMMSRVRRLLIQQYVLGSGGMPADIGPLQRAHTTQLAYLHRFALQRAVAVARDKPMSEAAVLARSKLYAGAGRELFYRGVTETLDEGWIVVYSAIDDRGTCSACLAAERASPFLPQTAIYPGQECFGRGRCRCTLRAVYDPAAYARLTRSA